MGYIFRLMFSFLKKIKFFWLMLIVVVMDIFFLVALSGITFHEYGSFELRRYYPECSFESTLNMKICVVRTIQKNMINPF